MLTQPQDSFATSETEITKIQELMYELRVGEIMTYPVMTVSLLSSMADAKELMRSRRVSGLPVVDRERLLGIVSVEDVIRWLEKGSQAALVSDWMTERVLTVRATEPAVQAINKFRTFHVGRLPVIDGHDRLVGIVTPGDVVDRVVRVLDALYREAEPGYRHEHSVLTELTSEQTTITLRYTVAPMDFDRSGIAATRIKRLLEIFHVVPQTVRRAGIAVYEAEMNLTIHAKNGGRIVARLEPNCLELVVTDDGPGIPDLDLAMTPGFSTAPDWIRELGFGAGMGLANIKNCADRFSVKSQPGVGTTLQIGFDLPARHPAMRKD